MGLIVRLPHPIHTSLPPAQAGSAFASCLSRPPRCSRVLRPANVRAAYCPISLLTRVSVIVAWSNSVDATDEYLYYVSDLVNIRLLRLAKTFAATEMASLGSAQ